MADPHFRPYVSVYEINKIFTPLVADQTEHSKINSISPKYIILYVPTYQNSELLEPDGGTIYTLVWYSPYERA